MELQQVAKNFNRVLKQNSPTILTSLGVAGVLSTAVLAAKGAQKALVQIMYAESERTEPLTGKEKVELTWQYYVPAGVSGGITAMCIVFAHSISHRRNAALVSALTLSETAFREYQNKTVELMGSNKAQKIQDAVAQEKVSKSEDSSVVFVGTGKVLCYDTYSDRYFSSSAEKIRSAENKINQEILNDGYACLNDFYRLLNLPVVEFGDEVGWNTDRLVELAFTSALKDEEPALAITHQNRPFSRYDKIW